MEFPADLKYSADHEWIRVLEGGEAQVGITDFAQSELGELVYIEVETDLKRYIIPIHKNKKFHDIYIKSHFNIFTFVKIKQKY